MTETTAPSSRAPRLLALVAAALFFAPLPSFASCDLCAIYTGTLMQQRKVGPWLGVFEQYSNFGTIKMGRDNVANSHDEWVRSSVTQLAVGYAFTPWLGVQAVVPLISREYRRLENGVETRGDSSGLGDVSFLLRATPYSGTLGHALVHAEVFGGVKTPTGDSERLGEGMGGGGHHEDDDGHDDPHELAARRPRHAEHPSAVHGHALALGSGSTDGVVGANLFASWKRLFLTVQLQYSIRGRGDFGYQFANDLIWFAGPGVYLVTRPSWTATFQLLAIGEDKGRDVQMGVKDADSGATTVYLGPAVGVSWMDHLSANLAIDLPMLQDVNGTQLVPDYRLRGGLTWRF
jgi:hypothetical protein